MSPKKTVNIYIRDATVSFPREMSETHLQINSRERPLSWVVDCGSFDSTGSYYPATPLRALQGQLECTTMVGGLFARLLKYGAVS